MLKYSIVHDFLNSPPILIKFVSEFMVCKAFYFEVQLALRLRFPLRMKKTHRLGCWEWKWGMRFQPVKCNMMQLTRKRIKKIHASYTLEGTDLENVESIKYLGVTIANDLRWNTHVRNVYTKANRTLGFLRQNLHSYPQEVKEAAYKGLVRPWSMAIRFGTPQV